jgi:hypothetical protein
VPQPLGTTRLPAQPCPNCSHKLDAASPVGKDIHIPKPNDYTVCLNCQQILQFDAAMILHKRKFNEVDDSCKEEIARIIVTMRNLLPHLKAQKN